MALQGVRETKQFAGGRYAERQEAWDKRLNVLYPNGAGKDGVALTALMKGLGRAEQKDDFLFNHIVRSMLNHTYRLGANLALQASAGPTTITLATNTTEAQRAAAGDASNANYSPQYIKEGDTLRVVETNEQIIVTGTPVQASGGNWTIPVIRASGGSGAAVNISTANPHVQNMGSSYGENSVAPDSTNRSNIIITSAIQTFRESVRVSYAAQMVANRTGEKPNVTEMRDAQWKLNYGHERALFFSKGVIDTNNGNHKLSGIVDQVPSYNNLPVPSNGMIGMNEIEEWITRITAGYGSGEKVVFCGARFLQSLNRAIRLNSRVNYNLVNEKHYDMDFMKLTGCGISLMFKQHPVFSHSPSAFASDGTLSYSGDDSLAVVVDMSYLQPITIKDGVSKGGMYVGKNLTAYKNEQGASYDRWDMIMETGLVVTQPDAFYLIEGVVGGKVDS